MYSPVLLMIVFFAWYYYFRCILPVVSKFNVERLPDFIASLNVSAKAFPMPPV